MAQLWDSKGDTVGLVPAGVFVAHCGHDVLGISAFGRTNSENRIHGVQEERESTGNQQCAWVPFVTEGMVGEVGREALLGGKVEGEGQEFLGWEGGNLFRDQRAESTDAMCLR